MKWWKNKLCFNQSLSLPCSPQTDKDKDPDYDSLPSQTSQSESSMLQVICRPEATSKEEAYTFHTVHSKFTDEATATSAEMLPVLGSVANKAWHAMFEETVKMVWLSYWHRMTWLQ